jgi:hypothetical protein
MNWDAVSAISEAIGVVIVVLSVLYLAKQIRQSNMLARSQTRQRVVEQSQQELYQGFIANPSIYRSLSKQEPLTEEEWIQLSGWLISAMRQREYEWFQYKDGHLDEDLWKACSTVITFHLGTARTRKWWDLNGNRPFDREFCAMVAELMDESGETSYFTAFRQLVADADPGQPGEKT